MRDMLEDSLGGRLEEFAAPEALRVMDATGDAGTLWNDIDAEGFASALVESDAGGVSWRDAFGLIRATGRWPTPVPLVETMLARWLLSKAGMDIPRGALSLTSEASLIFEAGTVSGVAEATPWGRSVEAVVQIADDRILLLPTRSAAMARGRNTAGEPRDTLSFRSVSPLAEAPRPDSVSSDSILLGLAAIRSAQIAGAVDRILDMTSTYAQDRRQFKRAIAAFQTIQHQLAVMAEHGCAATVGADAAFTGADIGLSDLLIGSAKIIASEAASVTAASAHAIHGAIGITDEYALHHSTRRLWSWRTEAGSVAYWSERLGRLAGAAGGDGLWPLVVEHGSLLPEALTS